MTVYNFGAGPAQLPKPVMDKVHEELLAWQDGMPLFSISHRSVDFGMLHDKIIVSMTKLLNIPDTHQILLFQGGARAQFSMVPMNLLPKGNTADHVITGIWSKLAYEDGCTHGDLDIAAISEQSGFKSIPAVDTWAVNPQAQYLHYTDNETVNGLEFHTVPKVDIPLVADMTSSLLTKKIDFQPFSAIYASSQKNLGIAGVTIVIVHRDRIKQAHPGTPLLYNYQAALMGNSLINTPVTFTWYVLSLVLDWLESIGGVHVVEKANKNKSDKLYKFIDQSEFYENSIEPHCRSRVNIPFHIKRAGLEKHFLSEANEANLKQLKGHRTVGGLRASLYNAMDQAGVDALINFMQTFQKQYA